MTTINKKQRVIYAKTAYAKTRENKDLCAYCNILVITVNKKNHELTTKHINNVKNGKFDFHKSITNLMNDILKNSSTTKLLELHGLLQAELFDKEGFEIEEEMIFDIPKTDTKEEIIFCDQEIPAMIFDLRELNDNASYNATEIEKIDKEIDELAIETYPSLKIKLLSMFRKINNMPELLKKKQIELRDKELKELEKRNKEEQEKYKPERKIIKEIRDNITIPKIIIEECLSEISEMNHTVNSNDEEYDSDVSDDDINHILIQESLRFYNLYDSRTRISLLQKELENCLYCDEYQLMKNRLEQKSANMLIGKEEMSEIYCCIKGYKISNGIC